MTDLTNNSKKLLCLLYKEFLERKKHSVSYALATQFQDYLSIQESFLPDEAPDDVVHILKELDRSGYIKVIYGDGIPEKVFLLDKAIFTMENRFKDNISAIVDFVLNLSTFL